MKVTRVIAVAVMAATVCIPALHAQSLRKASPPSEFPSASYKGSQYVDSRGCVYIRAGIDGNVTWVPRVSRSRKHVCGARPTPVANTTKAQKKPEPKLITLEPTPTTPATTTKKQRTAAPTIAPRPAQAAPAAPTGTAAVETTPPRTVRVVAPVRTKTTRTTTRRPTKKATAKTATSCRRGTSVSQQYTNRSGVRCGPQQTRTTRQPVEVEAVQTARVVVVEPRSPNAPTDYPIAVSPRARIVPRHVHENRQNTRNVYVPDGYRRVTWGDDRLNPYRAERTTTPARLTAGVSLPYGYRPVERSDGRLNQRRGIRSGDGDQRTTAIWTETLPRKLAPVPTNNQSLVLHRSTAQSFAETEHTPFSTSSRESTRRRGRPDDAGGSLR